MSATTGLSRTQDVTMTTVFNVNMFMFLKNSTNAFTWRPNSVSLWDIQLHGLCRVHKTVLNLISHIFVNYIKFCINIAIVICFLLLFYRCICDARYTGKTCEAEINICSTDSPCQNNAPCGITDTGYRCYCLIGYSGVNCENGKSKTTGWTFVG
jgi:hypothetical protein